MVKRNRKSITSKSGGTGSNIKSLSTKAGIKSSARTKSIKSRKQITKAAQKITPPKHRRRCIHIPKPFSIFAISLVFSVFKKHTRLIKAVLFWGILATALVWIFWDIPLPSELATREVPVSTKLFDRNGKLIYEIYTDKKSTPIKLNELPPFVWQATIAVEDKDFYKHYGVSFTGIIRAAYNTLLKNKLQGGSTLTQQLVKNTLLSPERTLKRKIRELALTLLVETFYSKDQILEMYLNQIPYGGTAYGIGAAAETYFGKEAKNLNLAEAALLAGLPAAPSRFSPFGAYPEMAKGRQETVLKLMWEDKYISEEEMQRALDEKTSYAKPQKLQAPHFALWVKSLLADKYGDAATEKGGLRVTTTLDLELQQFAESAVATEVAKLKKQKVGNGAALVTHPSTGEILAMVGSKDYFAEDEDGKVNIIFANRQPGSSIKPLNYALALKDEKITLSTPLADVPTCFSVQGQTPYCPKNYDGSFHGAVQARFALGNSYNIPAVRVLALNGIENFIDFATQMGITTFSDPKNYGLSLTLGGGEVKPADMAVAFGIFANQGIKQPLISILKVEDWKGNILEQTDLGKTKLSGQRVLESEITYLISQSLYDNNARSAAFGTSSYLNVKGHAEVSVKTGTTNDRRDNWTIGYTPQILVLSWVGNNDNSVMTGAISGISGASPIWNTIMKNALDKSERGYYDASDKGHSWPPIPQGIVGANVCATTGNLPTDTNNPECPTRFEYFLKGKVGAGIQTGRTDVQIDKTNGALAYPELPPDLQETQNHPFLLDPLGTMVCLDCPIASASAKLSYPLASLTH